MSPEASAKSLARFLTERGVQTPSGRSTVWQDHYSKAHEGSLVESLRASLMATSS